MIILVTCQKLGISCWWLLPEIMLISIPKHKVVIIILKCTHQLPKNLNSVIVYSTSRCSNQYDILSYMEEWTSYLFSIWLMKVKDDYSCKQDAKATLMYHWRCPYDLCTRFVKFNLVLCTGSNDSLLWSNSKEWLIHKSEIANYFTSYKKKISLKRTNHVEIM